MADYVPLTWADEVPATTPVKYEVRQDGGAVIHTNVTIAPVTSITPGTPLTAANLNHIEQGILAVEQRFVPLETSLGNNFSTNDGAPRWHSTYGSSGAIAAIGSNIRLYLSAFYTTPPIIKHAFIYIKSKWAAASESNYLVVGATNGTIFVPHWTLYSLAANIPNTICVPINIMRPATLPGFYIQVYGANTLATSIAIAGYAL